MIQIEEKNNEMLSTSIVKKAFREYYFNYTKKLEFPRLIKQREFGIKQFGGSGMIRHLSFDNISELVATLIREVPSDVYHSNSYYRFPTSPINEKQWCGADLIFDIDGKDLDLECVASHSYSICNKCGNAIAFQTNKSEYFCPSCNSKEANKITLPCDNCIKASKKQVKHLIEILADDLGIAKKEIRVYFSGSNGFHISIRNNTYIPHDPHLRSEIIDYVLGRGLMVESLGVRKDGLITPELRSDGFRIKFPAGGLVNGWRYRVAKKMKLQLDNSSEERLRQLVKNHGGYEGFRAEFNKIVHEMGTLIDHQVTTDIHRIFRMPGTLNSKSGLAKVRCTDIDSYDPFKDACLLGDEKVSIRVKTPARLRLKGKNIEVKKESLELPAYAAVYLICKGLAEAT